MLQLSIGEQNSNFPNVMKKLVYLIISILTSLSIEAQENIQHAENLLRSTLQKSIEYNHTLIHSLAQMRDKESAEKEGNLSTLMKKKKEALQAAAECATYLKQQKLTAEELANYPLTMSQYRLKTALQLDRIFRERKRLKEEDWFGSLHGTTRQTIENLGYIRHNYRNAELKHQDTEQRINEYFKKSENLALDILSVLHQITSTESAKKYEHDLRRMFQDLDESVSILNVYRLDGAEANIKVRPEIYKEFYNLNIRISKEINRIKQSNDGDLSNLKDFIISLPQPVLWLFE